MGKALEQTFPERRHTNGQQAHEKMLKIFNHRNAHENAHNEIPLHTHEGGYDFF